MAAQTQTLEHDHVFLGADHDRNARRVWFVIALTAVRMVVARSLALMPVVTPRRASIDTVNAVP